MESNLCFIEVVPVRLELSDLEIEVDLRYGVIFLEISEFDARKAAEARGPLDIDVTGITLGVINVFGMLDDEEIKLLILCALRELAALTAPNKGPGILTHLQHDIISIIKL